MFAQSPSSPGMSPVTLHGSIQFDLPSTTTGRTYRIFVYKPDVPPGLGYPMVVTTDGNGTFPLMATMDAAFALTGSAALIVSVGYPTDDVRELFSLRGHDFGAGAEAFRRFLREELLPTIAAAFSVSAHDATLYGHSFGGAFALGVLFNDTSLFRNYVLSSPSIWVDDCSVLRYEAAFAKLVETGVVAPRVLILVGANENHAQWRMVENARDLAERLQTIGGRSEYEVRFAALANDDHLTALGTSIGQTLAFALRGPTYT
jgi:uncharacterized protein